MSKKKTKKLIKKLLKKQAKLLKKITKHQERYNDLSDTIASLQFEQFIRNGKIV